jgi:glucokinase
MAYPMVIGIDVGATKIAAALVTSNGKVRAAQQIETRADQETQYVLDRIAGLINKLAAFSAQAHDTKTGLLLGVGIGIPGQVNAKEGIVREAVNLGWDEVCLSQEIGERLDKELPIWIDTDTNASTLGEFYYGAARNCQDFVYISIGSGLGAGIMVHGALVSGATWKGAELGHLSLDPNGLACKCGLYGCAETIVSGPGLLNLTNNLLSQKRHISYLSEENELTTTAIISAALNGDELALAAFSEMGRHLGIVISICAAVINPALVVIGGGLGLASFSLIVPAARREIEQRILPSLHTKLKILVSEVPSSALGAASLVFNQEKKR